MISSAIKFDGSLMLETIGADKRTITVREVKAPAAASPRRLGPASALLLRHMLGPYLAKVGETGRHFGEPCGLRAGQTLIEDLRHQPRLSMNCPFHAVDIVIPWSVFDRIAEQIGADPIMGFDIAPRMGLQDRTIAHLIEAILPPLRENPHAARHYTDHLAQALATHVAHAYGRVGASVRPARGGLAPHVLRRAQAMLQANMQAGMSLESLAEECGLSARHFARAFQESAGVTPHRWLTNARITMARSMIGAGELSLAQIADACGFSDQSHLTRLFKRELGVAPAAWRRAYRGVLEPIAVDASLATQEPQEPQEPHELASPIWK
jgi:AraC family transcriptional regulator